MFCNSVFKSSAKNSHIHVLVVQLLFVFCRLSVTHSIKQVRNCSRFMRNQPATIANLSGGLMKTRDRAEMSLMSSLLRPQAENIHYKKKKRKNKPTAHNINTSKALRAFNTASSHPRNTKAYHRLHWQSTINQRTPNHITQ